MSYTYRGKLLEEMTKEELVEAVKTLGIFYTELLESTTILKTCVFEDTVRRDDGYASGYSRGRSEGSAD